MKVLFFLNMLREGTSIVNREASFAEELVHRGCKVSVLSYFKATLSLSSELDVYTIFPVHFVDSLRQSQLMKLVAFFKIFFVLCRVRPEVVMVDLPEEAWWACLLRPVFRYKIIFTYHGIANEGFYDDKETKKLRSIRNFYHRMLRKADRILVVSEFLKTELKRIGLSTECIYNGYNTKIFVNNGGKRDFTKVLFVGRFTEYKGIRNIVKVFARSLQSQPGIHLEIGGHLEDPEYVTRIQQFIREEELESAVTILGPLTTEELVAKLQTSGVFINGSLDEAFGMALLEAQAVGMPCVAFAAGGIPEVVADQKTGLLADPGDIEDLALKLCCLLRDRSLYQFCQRNLEPHISQFNYVNLSKKLMRVLYGLKQGY